MYIYIHYQPYHIIQIDKFIKTKEQIKIRINRFYTLFRNIHRYVEIRFIFQYDHTLHQKQIKINVVIFIQLGLIPNITI